MEQEELGTLIGSAAVLMEQFERRCAAIEAQQQALTQSLHDLAQQVPYSIQQSANQMLDTVPGQVLGQVREGLERPVHDYQQRLRNAGDELGKGMQALTEQAKVVGRLHRWLVWKVAAFTAVCLLLLLAGGAWLAAHYAQVIQENQVSAAVAKAYGRADVTLCGEQLCARVDPKAPRYGTKGEYWPVSPR